MFTQVLSALRIFLVLTVLTGGLYPLVVTGVGQFLFPDRANGSLIAAPDGQVLGSALVGQQNNAPDYFWSRPSVVGYMQSSDPAALVASGGSNAGSTSATLAQVVAEREAAFRVAHQLPAEVAVPADMLFASGSGLDPHISPEAARLQIERVARARNLPFEQVAALVDEYSDGPDGGLFGQPRVNVLLLNLALDALK